MARSRRHLPMLVTEQRCLLRPRAHKSLHPPEEGSALVLVPVQLSRQHLRTPRGSCSVPRATLWGHPCDGMANAYDVCLLVVHSLPQLVRCLAEDVIEVDVALLDKMPDLAVYIVGGWTKKLVEDVRMIHGVSQEVAPTCPTSIESIWSVMTVFWKFKDRRAKSGSG